VEGVLNVGGGCRLPKPRLTAGADPLRQPPDGGRHLPRPALRAWGRN